MNNEIVKARLIRAQQHLSASSNSYDAGCMEIKLLLDGITVDKKPENTELIENLRRVFDRISSNLEPGNDDHSAIIDLVNHGQTIIQQLMRA